MAVVTHHGVLVSALARAGRRPHGPALVRALGDPRSYERQIDRLMDRHATGRGLDDLREGEVSLGVVATRRSEVARLLAKTVPGGDYHPAPARLRTIRVGGRERTVFALGLVDALVHGVVADTLEAATAPTLSPRLCSYRPGRPWWRAAQELAAFVRASDRLRREGGDPAVGDLYVLRRDIHAYTDSIPVAAGSPLWAMLADALALDATTQPAAWSVLAAVIRPEVTDHGGPPRRLDVGVPTGQPISCVLFNLYLRDVDTELAAIPGGFYARYSDDIVFAHHDPEVARSVASRLDRRIADLGLALNPKKSRDLYLTRSGRPSAAWLEARGTRFVPLLGLLVGADGTLSLEPAKARELVRDLRRRASVAASVARSDDEAAHLACAVVRRALDAGETQHGARSALLVRRVVTDRRQLAELDHRIARETAGVLVHDRSIRAFRAVPPSVLRERYGLPSLVALRNGAARDRARGPAR